MRRKRDARHMTVFRREAYRAGAEPGLNRADVIRPDERSERVNDAASRFSISASVSSRDPIRSLAAPSPACSNPPTQATPLSDHAIFAIARE
jgi:hypothetical protein